MREVEQDFVENFHPRMGELMLKLAESRDNVRSSLEEKGYI